MYYWLCSYDNEAPVAIPYRDGDTVDHIFSFTGSDQVSLVNELDARYYAPDSPCFR